MNALLLARAEEKGARLVKERVQGIEREGAGWRIETAAGSFEADYAIVALGARNPLKDYGSAFKAADTMLNRFGDVALATFVDQVATDPDQLAALRSLLGNRPSR